MAARPAGGADEITSATRLRLRKKSSRSFQEDLGTPLYVRGSKRRRAEAYTLERDFKYLEREQKVTNVLNSGAFRAELEGILQGQLDGSRKPRRTRPDALQRLQENIVPASQFGGGSRQNTTGGGGGGGELVIPINDLRGTSASKYTLAERQTRCKLAAVYRLADLFGWAQLIHNHITARAPGEEECYLVNPFGLMYQEMTASNLVKVDLEGDILDPGTTQLGINGEGFSLHSAIHAVRKDIKCIIHVHNTPTLAVSAMSCGLLPVSSEAVSLGEISYHDYKGTAYNYEGDLKITEDLGPTNKVLVMRNHGVIVMGQTIEEAFHLMRKAVEACKVQVAVMPVGLANICQVPGGVWQRGGASTRGNSPSLQKRQLWDVEFEALMRMLDNKGYNTGYLYKGMSLLQPASPSRQTFRKKAKKEQTRTEVGDLPNDPWNFLEQNKLPQDKPLTKAKERHKPTRRDEPTQEEQDEGSKSPWTQKGSSSRNGPGKAPKMSASQDPGMAGDEQRDEDRNLTALEMAELTAQRVAVSTGKAVEKLTLASNTKSRNASLKSNEVNQSSVIHRSAELDMPPNLTPLQQVEYTAEQVAHSTGEAVEKLAAQSRSISSEDRSQAPTHYTLLTRVSSDQIPKHAKRKRVRERNRALANGPIPYPQTSETESDSDFNTASSRSKKSTPTHSAAKTSTAGTLNPMHTPASLTFMEGSSAVEKMTHTAEVVAQSTSKAVQNLSSTLTRPPHVNGYSSGSDTDSA